MDQSTESAELGRLRADFVGLRVEYERMKAEAAENESKLSVELVKANAELVKANARIILTLVTQIHTFQALIDFIDKSDMDAIPSGYLENYSKSQRDPNTSMTYMNAIASSVTDRERASNELPLNKMRRRMTEQTPDRIRLNELTLNDAQLLETILCKALFAENKTEFETFLQSFMESLDKVRQMLYFIRRTRSVREVDELQTIAALFLEEFTRYFHPNAHTKPGQNTRLEGELMVGVTAEMSKKEIHGYSDLILGAIEGFDLADALCIFELKAPETTLYHSGAHASKDQLLFELEMIGQMHTDTMLLGGLLDMFSIAIAVRQVNEEGKSFFMSERVSESRAFLLRLLLLLCKDKDEVWAELSVFFSTTEIPLPNEEDEGDGAGESQEGREKEEEVDDEEKVDEKGGRGLRSGDEKGRDRAAGGVSRMVVEEVPNPIFKEEYEKDLSRMLSWDAKRKGLTLLTAAALNRVGKEHSEPGETLKWRSSFF